MHVITEMALPHLPVGQPDFWADPMPAAEAARAQHPWLAKFEGGFIVHGFQATKDLIYMDDKLRPGFGGIVAFYEAQGSPWAKFMEEMILTRSGAEHARLRASVAEAFTPRGANQSRPLMRKVISELLDEWVPKGRFDFALFASYFPVAVICGLLGVSAEPIPRLRESLEVQLGALTLNRDLKPALMAGFETMSKFTDGLVIARERRGDAAEHGLIDDLIAVKNAGGLDETELRFMIMVLLYAGYDTSKNMLTLTMHMMLQHPEMYARCADDIVFCGKVVDEMLRHSTIATPYRLVAEDFDYDGVRFTKGALVIFGMPLSGRDPAAFDDPLTFDPERHAKNRHVAFGRGAHICLGQFLARTQLEEGLHLIAQRLKNPRRDGDVAWRPFLGTWGLRALPIAFDPAP